MDDNTMQQFTMQQFTNKFKSVNFERYIELHKMNQRSLIFFTDGSCHGNGKKTSIGGYSAICVNGYKKGLLLYGKVNTIDIPATNIRAEGIAIIKVFKRLIKLIESKKWDDAIIYSDSKFWIDMIYKYMPNWAPDAFDTKANPDLTKKVYRLYNELQSSNKQIDVKHVYAHNKKGGATSTVVSERFAHDNNELADSLANIARELPDCKLQRVIISF